MKILQQNDAQVGNPKLDVLIISFGKETSFLIALVADILTEANRVLGEERIKAKILQRVSDIEDIIKAQPYDLIFLVSDNENVPRMGKTDKKAVRHLCRTSRTVSASGGAVGILADLHLLDGRKAALPARLASVFLERYSRVNFAEQQIVQDGRLWTCSGGVRTANMALSILGELIDTSVSLKLSERLLFKQPLEEKSSRGISLSARYGFRNPALSRAIEFMRKNCDDGISSKDVAMYAGVSKRQIERLFRNYLSVTPLKFLRKLRIDRARELLLHSDLSVIEIGHAVGMPNSSHLARHVRKYFGCQPRRVRQLSKQNLSGIEEDQEQRIMSCKDEVCRIVL